MYNINVFGSGSSGNAILVDTGDCLFLLDAGLSIRDIKKGLRKIGIKMSSISYIFCTHSHSDHMLGIKSIVDLYNIPVICNMETALTLDISSTMIITAEHGEYLELKNIAVTCRDTPHDVACLNFAFINSVGEKLLYLTDCGTDDYMYFEEQNVYIIEANYSRKIMKFNVDNHKIDISRYHRAQTGLGHLEIGQTINILKDSVGEKTSDIILSHLSSANGDGDAFKNRVIKEVGIDNVYVAKKGLSLNYGDNPNAF